MPDFINYILARFFIDPIARSKKHLGVAKTAKGSDVIYIMVQGARTCAELSFSKQAQIVRYCYGAPEARD